LPSENYITSSSESPMVDSSQSFMIKNILHSPPSFFVFPLFNHLFRSLCLFSQINKKKISCKREKNA
jgi:hypothetical protein